jgi:prolyl-tRNA synthetase
MVHHQSQLLATMRREAPAGETSKNAQILMRGGYIQKPSAGVYTFLPLGLRVLKKVSQIVREEMLSLPRTHEVLMPALQPRELWEQTGRWEEAIGDVMYTVDDNKLALGPTHEEIVTDLFRQQVSSYKQLPLGLFQIQNKFRRELRAKSGLLRGREFLMKDLYSFHTDAKAQDEYYDEVAAAYLRVYNRCGLDALLTKAAGGMFAKYSDEFQVLCETGEDTVYLRADGREARNEEIVEDSSSSELIEYCGGEVRTAKAIEVGNIFRLGTKFSKPLDALVTDEEGNRIEILMGCYGIGISRVIGTVVEVLGTDRGITWPEEIAPFDAHVIDLVGTPEALSLAERIDAIGKDILLDDREGLSAGERFAEGDLIGAPVRYVFGKSFTADGTVEVRRGTEVSFKKLEEIQ